ncbi:MAG: ABC transporter permease, partial [Clostridia bacterium]|nr:ABC transporter permease [Clostridia bacterium]
MKDKRNCSLEHALYLKKTKLKTLAVVIARFSVLFFLLLFWELAARYEWVNPFITSSPSRIWKTLVSLYQNGSLFLHLSTTL